MKYFENQVERNGGNDASALIDALFREFKVIEGKEPSKFISPSSLNCPVSSAFKLQGVVTEQARESFQSKSFLDNGNDRHERIQEFLSNTEYWVDVEEFIAKKNLPLEILEKAGYEVLLYSEEYQSRFRCDGILLINGEYYILEIKTERGSVFAKRTGPDPKHYAQGVTYSLFFDVNKIMWVYEGREYLEQKPFVQIVAQAEKEQMSQYIKSIISNKGAPENLERNLSACRYCSYRNYCKMYFNEIKKKEMAKLWNKEQNLPRK